MAFIDTGLDKFISDIGVDDFFTVLIDVRDISDTLYEVINDAYSEDTSLDVDRVEDAKKRLKENPKFIAELSKLMPEIRDGVQEIKAANARRKAASAAEEKQNASWREYMSAKAITPEAPEDSPLGMFAFPASRSFALPREPDTKIEKQLFKAIEQHLHYSGEINEDLAGLIEEILLKNLYPSVFKRAPVGTVIYRGMSVYPDWMTKLTHGEYIRGESGEITRPMTFQPRSGKFSTSWSRSLRIAEGWAGRSYGDEIIPVVITATVSDEMLTLDGRALYSSLPEFERYRREEEVICFDEVKCIHVKWDPFE